MTQPQSTRTLGAFTPMDLQVVTKAGPTSGQNKIVSGESPNLNVCPKPDANGIVPTLDGDFRGGEPFLPFERSSGAEHDQRL